MGLALIFIVLPITLLLLIIWAATGKIIFGRLLAIMWIGGILMVSIGFLLEQINKKIELTKEDYHGDYIIDRTFFPGKEADWQYNHYKFTISSNNVISLYEKDDDDSTHIITRKFSTVTPHSSARLIIYPDSNKHHFFNTNPTTYRKGKKFFLVFNSAKFSNMYFKKGKWEPIH